MSKSRLHERFRLGFSFSADPKYQTGKSISTSTLVRMFVSNQNNHIPYKHTLDILSDFDEYSDGQIFVNATLVRMR